MGYKVLNIQKSWSLSSRRPRPGAGRHDCDGFPQAIAKLFKTAFDAGSNVFRIQFAPEQSATSRIRRHTAAADEPAPRGTASARLLIGFFGSDCLATVMYCCKAGRAESKLQPHRLRRPEKRRGGVERGLIVRRVTATRRRATCHVSCTSRMNRRARRIGPPPRRNAAGYSREPPPIRRSGRMPPRCRALGGRAAQPADPIYIHIHRAVPCRRPHINPTLDRTATEAVDRSSGHITPRRRKPCMRRVARSADRGISARA
jgi:hypothetical protein